MLKTKNSIEKWLIKQKIENYTIHDNLIVDIDGDLNVYSVKNKELVVQFGVVTGNFTCTYNLFTTLKNCPHTVGGDYICSDNRLISLEYCPTIIHGNFECHRNSITSLEYAPKKIEGNLYFHHNPIEHHLNYEFDVQNEIWLSTETILPGLEQYYDQFNRIKIPFDIFKPYMDNVFLRENLHHSLTENSSHSKFKL